MLIVARWLNQYLSQPLSINQLQAAMEAAGIEVEDAKHPPQFDEGIVTATVKEVKDHPRADRLQIAVVESEGQTHEVVCGAPNLAAGQRVVWARPGATLPDGTAIEQADIRSATSEGMLCSERELGLGKNHEGILELGPEVAADQPLAAVFTAEYTILDIKTAANRWDLQSYLGIAREVTAHSEAELVFDELTRSPVEAQRVEDLFTNHTSDAVTCYGLVWLRLDAAKPSPAWMQQYLRLSGVKPISAVVDITNYVMLALGQPLHAFSGEAVTGPVEIRFGKTDEVLLTLDGVERRLSSEDLVIADQNGPIGLAGVMGGQKSEINDKTTTIALEAATFDSALVRKMAKRHGLRTEASARFERGIPVQAPKQALRHAIGLLQEHAEAEVTSYQHERSVWPWVQHIGLRAARARQFLGIEELEREDMARYLKQLHFDAEVFDIAAEARRHLGKPYKWGAKFKTDGTEAFDCSYLIDYVYSLIGCQVGHTALGQYEVGRPIADEDLLPGDVVFLEGYIDKSATDHYYTPNTDGTHTKHELEAEKRVGHNGIYVGDNKVVMAAEYRYQDGEWVKRDNTGVMEVDLSEFTDNPGYVGARRFLEDIDDYIRITVPWWRPDVRSPEDALEELIKLIGLEQVPATLPAWHPKEVTTDTSTHRSNQLRWVLYGLGLHEVATYPFISEQDSQLFRQPGSPLRLANPRSQEQAYLRTSLLPLLIHAVVNNTSYQQQFGVFEQARVFLPAGSSELPQERNRLGLVYQGTDILQLKAYLDALFAHTNVDPEIVTTTQHESLHPARQAQLEVNGEHLGWFGVLHPEINQTLKTEHTLLCAELELDVLLAQWQPANFRPLPKYPSSYRDITLRVAPRVTWGDIRQTLSQLEALRVSFLDEYHKDDQKAVTIHVELQAHQGTLTDAQIETRMQTIATTLGQQLGAEVAL